MRIAGDGFDIACVATPGHTANHMCYALAQEKALFSGDHVMGWSTSVIAPPDGDMGQYLASLDRLAARDDEIFYPTHGSPIRQPRRWLHELIAHRRLREAQILDAVEAWRPPFRPSWNNSIRGSTLRLRGAAALQTHGASGLSEGARPGHAKRPGNGSEVELGEESLEPRGVAAMVPARRRGFRRAGRSGCRWCRPGAPGSRCR